MEIPKFYGDQVFCVLGGGFKLHEDEAKHDERNFKKFDRDIRRQIFVKLLE